MEMDEKRKSRKIMYGLPLKPVTNGRVDFFFQPERNFQYSPNVPRKLSWKRDCRGASGLLVGFGERLVELAETVRLFHQTSALRIIETVDLVPDAPARPVGVPSIVLSILQAKHLRKDPQVMRNRKAVAAVLVAEEVEEIVEARPRDCGEAKRTRLVS